MTYDRKKICKALRDRGFTGNIELFFWHNDGWYCNCDQLMHDWLGQHSNHAVQQIKEGMLDQRFEQYKQRLEYQAEQELQGN